MSKLKMSSEELRVERLQLHDSIQKRSKAELLAVEEMMKHPLSFEQMRAQIRQHQKDAERLEKRNPRPKEQVKAQFEKCTKHELGTNKQALTPEQYINSDYRFLLKKPDVSFEASGFFFYFSLSAEVKERHDL